MNLSDQTKQALINGGVVVGAVVVGINTDRGLWWLAGKISKWLEKKETKSETKTEKTAE